MRCAVKGCMEEAEWLLPLSGRGWTPLCRRHAEKVGELRRDDLR